MGVIQGVITDQNTGKPISGVAVTVLDANSNPVGVATFSDAGGNFYLSDPSLDNAANQVEFTMTGYQTYMVGSAFASNNVSLAPAGTLSISTPQGVVTPGVSPTNPNSLVNLLTGKTLAPPLQSGAIVKTPVSVQASANLTWLWITLGIAALGTTAFFIFRHKPTAAAPAAK